MVECDRNFRAVAGNETPTFDILPMEELMKQLVAKQLADVAKDLGVL